MWRSSEAWVFVAFFSAVLLFPVASTTNGQVSLTTKTERPLTERRT